VKKASTNDSPPQAGDKPKRGRPFKQIDARQVELLAGVFCSNEEIASKLGCSSDTLTRNYADALEKGRTEAKTGLRATQYRLAKTNVAMAIWLGKQYLAQREPKIEIDVNKLDTDIDRELAKLAARGEAETSGETAESIH
jgi:transcriptional regulator with XRE-family HTH domain